MKQPALLPHSMSHDAIMSDRELDEILIVHWPHVLRMAKRRRDKRMTGFAISIAKNWKLPEWQPSTRQVRLMRKLLAELQSNTEHNQRVIER